MAQALLDKWRAAATEAEAFSYNPELGAMHLQQRLEVSAPLVREVSDFARAAAYTNRPCHSSSPST